MDIVLIRSKKHKGAVFLKVKQSDEHFICKVYPQTTTQNTERLASVIKKALEGIPATVSPTNNDHYEDDGHVSLGEEQAMRQAGAW